MVGSVARVLLAVLACLGTTCANAENFAERCGELSRQAKISVTFEDRPVVEDDSRNVQALNGLAGKPAASNHNVYGITHAKPYFRLNVVPRVISDGQGNLCAMPDISVRLGFSEFVVFMARDLTDRCRRNVIREHEEEHVNTWRSHLRASAQLLTTILLREVGDARMYASRDDAEAGIRSWVDALVGPWAKRVFASVVEAQQAIDTPASYAAVASRLRTCPSRVR